MAPYTTRSGLKECQRIVNCRRKLRIWHNYESNIYSDDEVNFKEISSILKSVSIISIGSKYERMFEKHLRNKHTKKG